MSAHPCTLPSGTTVTPLRDQVLIEPIRQAERWGRKTGSLWTPDNPDPKPPLWEGLVLATGPGDKLRHLKLWKGEETNVHRTIGENPCIVQPGDRVLFYSRSSAHDPANVTIDGQRYAIVFEEQHIAAILG